MHCMNFLIEHFVSPPLILFKVFDFFYSDGDPNNYLTYFRRATVFLAMGKSKSALPDLTKVIELKPDFTAVSFKQCQQFMEKNYSLFIHSFAFIISIIIMMQF